MGLKFDFLKEGYSKLSDKMEDEVVDSIGSNMSNVIKNLIIFPTTLTDYFMIYSYSKKSICRKINKSMIPVGILLVATSIVNVYMNNDIAMMIGVSAGIAFVYLIRRMR